jgi:hypothetical protein
MTVHTFARLPGSPLEAYRATGGMLPPGGVTVVRTRRGGWMATFQRFPGPRGTRHAFGDTRAAAVAAVEVTR